MKNPISLRSLVWLFLPALVICGLSAYIRPGSWKPVQQNDLLGNSAVYAYRQWQSTGVKLLPGDRFSIRASGEWQYSPEVGLHGPNGGLWAPDWYPLSGNQDGVMGGALIGRIGEEGAPFFVGGRYSGYADTGGTLYLRINDDLLGDNAGALALDIRVTPAPTPQP